MRTVLKYILLIFVTGTAVIVVALIWPRIILSPRPAALSEVRRIALESDYGRNLANVLGVTDEKNIQPLDIGELAGKSMTSFTKAAESYAARTFLYKTVQGLARGFSHLNPDEQAEIRRLICQPNPKPSGL